MYPEFLRIGPLDIHTYGLLVALGFASGLWLAAHRAAGAGLRKEDVADLGVWLVVAGILGAKLFYVTFYLRDFLEAWRAVGLRSLREGFVFYGGFIGASLATVVFARCRSVPLWPLADLLAPCLALGHLFGRLGCFFNGCCFGKPCSLSWAVRYPAGHYLAGVPVHPSQLYEAAGNLLLCGLLLWYTPRRRFAGQVWWFYLLGYGTLRLAVEFARGDYEHYWLGVFTNAQLISVLLVVAAIGGHEWGCRQTRYPVSKATPPN
jgi:phosphatidylglycerol:prolipoprotein diacylglycerol transferase